MSILIERSNLICHYIQFIFSNRFKAFSGWGQSMIMELLLRYKPKDTEELFDVLVNDY